MNEAFKALKGVPSWVWLAGAGAVVGEAKGVVIGVGDAVGVPRTSETLCQKAMREGDNWSASKYCPASDFLAWQGRGVAKTFNDLFK